MTARISTNAQQRLQEMANFVASSHSRFARNSILVENNSFRSSPLLVAAERYRIPFPNVGEFKMKIQNGKI